ncbi:hypothetical protein IX317_000414 [Fusobacterium sp. DD29]|uniref:hypothetical protein n=1 Tax=unclassified Fusobacterium TaxID=2648384 RepID=UPI001B8D0990|nr:MULTISPECIES: hypothetical protein [unclassified Fusobacterium]MBR8700448.1 hypothetical protein [Fusobacterium sp. DD45]MBR8710197.1 hypothetical protein [Fusobacterium sp. DD28]MBR8748754.1 hypothetical protein [Fusobacterium sp. DD29]MBR8750702.1 hypothetical protein [Fusobacterium sp. DD26]MBR8761021.1 hypothetical protein [Fusobacterium sp. DD25]
MKLDEKRKLEKARQKVHQQIFTNQLSPLTKEHVKNKILDEAAKKIAEGKLTTDKEIKDFILEKDSDYAGDNDIFKIILKIAPLALVLFFIFIFVFQSLYM